MPHAVMTSHFLEMNGRRPYNTNCDSPSLSENTTHSKMISNRQDWFQARPTPLKLKRKIEKSVVREAKDEEKNLNQVVKEMEETEKAAHRAQKVDSKAI